MRAEQLKERLSEARAVRVPARAPQWIIPAVKLALVISDIALAALSFTAAFYLREGHAVLQESGGRWMWSARFAPYGALLLFILPIRVLTLKYYDLYRLRGEFSLVEDGVRVFKATAIGTLLIVAAAFLYRGGFEYRAFSYARGVFVLDFLLALAAFGVVRLIVRSAQSFARRREINLIPTLVVGRGPEAALCIKEMRERPALGYRVIGVVENGLIDESVPETFEGVPIVSDIKGLPDAIREARANEVIITDPRISGDVLFDVMMRVGRRRGVEFRIAPSLFNCLPRKTEIDQIGALPMIRLFREPLSSAARIAKRASDIIVTAIAFLLLSPLWLIIALLVKLDSRGPVFYKQERVGMDGRIFLFYKFRTMHTGADDATHREFQQKYIAGSPDTNLGDNQRPAYKLLTDKRITRVGRILRRLSLDELPQLLNVLIGDMSIVGPRPPIPYEVEAYELWHRKRLDMKPGLTGLWQVSGRNRLTFDEMVRLDLFYIENWSLLLDLKIILRTLPVMLRGDDAY
ncbi:MAG TPA: sugar transferase [Pyrinomonadaceae bacterium]|jgi:exopolysaccharide biosynthesis polyprenyl glycosylphosphotransferase